MRNHLKAIKEILASGERLEATCVTHATKGSPGSIGACLIVPENSRPFGTIGGGIMEKRAIAASQNRIAQAVKHPTLASIAHREKAPNPSGLICGGGQINISIPFAPREHLDLIDSAIESAFHPSSSAYLRVDSEGIDLRNSSAKKLAVPSGEDWPVRIPLFPTKRVVICGAGHCGLALAQQMKRLDFHVTLFDSRSLSIDSQEPIDTLLLDAPANTALDQLPMSDKSYLIVMTHSYPSDLDVLCSLLDQPFKFIGLMGSPAKFKRIQSSLTSRGFSAEKISKIVCPVGIEIGSDTPQEIAVSVAAQIVLLEKQTR